MSEYIVWCLLLINFSLSCFCLGEYRKGGGNIFITLGAIQIIPVVIKVAHEFYKITFN